MATMRETIRKLIEHPDEVATVRWDGMTAGLLMRRPLEEVLNAARVQGIEVEVRTARGLLSSTYAVRLEGTARQLLPVLRRIAALEEG